MADGIICKMAHNGVDNESWIEDRDFLVQRSYPAPSTFLNIYELRKSGRDLYADMRETGVETASREFAELADIDV